MTVKELIDTLNEYEPDAKVELDAYTSMEDPYAVLSVGDDVIMESDYSY